MAKVTVTGAIGDFHSPWGERVSFPLGQESDRPIEDVYWLSRVNGAKLTYDSPEEEARGKELEEEENERILRPLGNVPQNANATVSVPSEGLYDIPIVVVNPRGLLDRYNPNTATPTVQVKLDADQVREIVKAVLQAEGTIPEPVKEKEAPPHTTPLAPPPIAERGIYDRAIDSVESHRDTSGEEVINPAEEVQREDHLHDVEAAKEDAKEQAKPPAKKSNTAKGKNLEL